MILGKVPLLIGLIGHRCLNLNELPKIQQELDAIIEKYTTEYKNTPVVVLTSLAIGADRLILSSRFRSRVKVYAVLPFDRIEYGKDFIDSELLNEFESALKECDEVITLGEDFEESELTDLEVRSKAYADAADWVAAHSKVLISVWDGNYSGKMGGTSETVRRSTLENAFQHHVHISASNGESVPRKLCECSGHEKTNGELVASLERQDLLNRSITTQEESMFGIFDQAATQLRKKYDRRLKVTLSLGLILVNAISIEQSYSLQPLLFLVLAIAAVTSMYWYLLKKSLIKQTYEDFRIIAEILRVKSWFQSAGINLKTFKHVGLKEFAEPWLAEFIADLNRWEILSIAVIESSDDMNINWLNVTSWLEEQIIYLEGSDGKQGAINRNLQKAKSYDRLAKSSIAAGILAYVMSKVFEYFASSGIPLNQRTIVGIFISFSLSYSAYVLAISQVMGHKEIAARYQSSLRILKNSAAELTHLLDSKDFEVAKKTIESIGIESLQESFYWFTVRRTRDVRPL